MRVKVINLRYIDDGSYFDQKEFEKFQEENDIEIIKSELVQKPEALFWTLVVSYTPRKKLLSENEFRIQEFMKQWRYQKAQSEGVSAFIILTNKQIEEIIRLKPVTKAELLKVKGFSDKKYAIYGEEIISMFTKEFVIA